MGCGVALTGGGAEQISQGQSTLGQGILAHSQVMTFSEQISQDILAHSPVSRYIRTFLLIRLSRYIRTYLLFNKF